MGGRGVLYMVWGETGRRLLARSTESLKRHHPELPVHVASLPDDLPPDRGLLEKARMLDASPFETTLFLDADTVVLDRLDFGFDRAERHGIACCICECPWARRYGGVSGDVIEYNTGVLFFTRRAAPLFERWKELAPTLDSSFYHVPPGTRQVGFMPFNDQASFALAVEETGVLPAVLPLNWNYRPRWHASFFGPLKIWHDYMDVPQAVGDANAYYARGREAVMQCVQMTLVPPAPQPGKAS